MGLMGADRVLCAAHNCMANIGARGDICINNFADAASISKSHSAGEFFLFLFIGIADVRKEGFDESSSARKGSHLDRAFTGIHPSSKVFYRHSRQVSFDRDFDEVSCLKNIDTIEKRDQTHPFKGEREEIVDVVEDDIRDSLAWHSNGKIIDLTAE